MKYRRRHSQPASKRTVLLAVMLMLTMSLSAAYATATAEEIQAGVRAFPYGVITYEDVVYASGLAHTQTSAEASAVLLKLDVYCPTVSRRTGPS